MMADVQRVADFSRHNGHPRMFGYVQSSGELRRRHGRSAGVRAQPERHLLAIGAGGDDDRAPGDRVAEGAGRLRPEGRRRAAERRIVANFAGLAVALRASTDVDLNQHGVAALPGKPRIYASAMTHMSIAQGRVDARDRQGRDRHVAGERRVPDGRRRALDADRRATARPAFTRSASSPPPATSTPARSIRSTRSPTCAHGNDSGCTSMARTARWRRESPHVGGAMTAIGRADSMSLDPHKWLFAPTRRRLPAGARCRGAAARVRDTAPATSTSSPIATCRSSRTGTTAPSCRGGSAR